MKSFTVLFVTCLVVCFPAMAGNPVFNNKLEMEILPGTTLQVIGDDPFGPFTLITPVLNDPDDFFTLRIAGDIYQYDGLVLRCDSGKLWGHYTFDVTGSNEFPDFYWTPPDETKLCSFYLYDWDSNLIGIYRFQTVPY